MVCVKKDKSISPLQTGLVVGGSNLLLTYGISVASGEKELKSGIIATGVGIASGSLAYVLSVILQ